MTQTKNSLDIFSAINTIRDDAVAGSPVIDESLMFYSRWFWFSWYQRLRA